MNEHEKSDPIVVAMKPANKAGRPVAEPVERRVGAKGNAGQHNTRRAQNRESVAQALARVRQAADASPSNTQGRSRMRAIVRRENGELNLRSRRRKPGEVLPGQPSYRTVKALWDKSMMVKRGFGRTCQTQRPARPARYGQG